MTKKIHKFLHILQNLNNKNKKTNKEFVPKVYQFLLRDRFVVIDRETAEEVMNAFNAKFKR